MSLATKNSGKKPRAKASTKQRKPDWDSTVNDVSEYRASPEDIARRQEAHRSKNLELVRKSAIEKHIATARLRALSDSTNRPPTNAFLKEILYSNGDASQLLDDTSRALRVAHHVFQDDVRRYKAVPAITSVNSDDEENAVYSRPTPADGLIKSSNEPRTKLDKLSDSVMKKKALNETFSASSDSEESTPEIPVQYQPQKREHGETTPTAGYPTRVDLQRFQRLLDQEDLSTIASECSAPVMEERRDATPAPTTAVEQATHGEYFQTQATDCQGVKKTRNGGQKKKTSKRNRALPSAEATDLQTLLESLEQKLQQYETQYKTKEDDSVCGTAGGSDSSLSTFTVSLLAALHRMMTYFNQLQVTVAEERKQRRVKEQQLLDVTNRADLLTKELIGTQEQFHVVLDELNRVRTEQRQEMDTIKATLSRVCKGGTVHTVAVTQPQQTSVGGTAQAKSGLVLRQCGSPATLVTTYKEFEGSPEQLKLLNTSQQNPQSSQVETDSSQKGLNAGQQEMEPDSGDKGSAAVEAPVADDAAMSLDQRIDQLREDHQDTLERFKKLGEALQMENPNPAPSWLTDM